MGKCDRRGKRMKVCMMEVVIILWEAEERVKNSEDIWI